MIVLTFIIFACKSNNYVKSSDLTPCLGLVHSIYKEYIFFNKIKVDTNTCIGSSYGYPLKDLDGYRKGYFKNGKQNGKWVSDRCYHYDSLGYSRSKRYLAREEYFKNGLRDSIYKIYDKEGKIIYSTYFKNGNGIEKDFHDNSQLYYEIKTENGYFTDTLKLYNAKGELMEKRLYKKDSLDYFINNKWCLKFRYYPNKETYLEVDSFHSKNLNQTDYRNTFRYKTKEEYDDDTFVKYTLKKITH
jgi:antitoxin component YwqK of YwqJK toxin-antitoxin module